MRKKNLPRGSPFGITGLRVMTNGDREGRIFLSHPHTNNGFSFLHTIIYMVFIFKKKKFAEASEYAGMRHIT